MALTAKPTTPPASAGKAAGMAGLYGGLGPVGYVNQLYAPLQAQLAAQQKARASTLQSIVGAILDQLKSLPADAYGPAAQSQNSEANAAADSLRAVNPNAQTQAMLAAIGAPQSQQANVTNQNSQTFNGGAALDQYLGGAVPSGVFASDEAGRNAYLAGLPSVVGDSAIQGLGRLGLLASQENSQLASEKASAQQNAVATLADYLTKNQSNKISQAAVLGNLLGYIPAGTLGNKAPVGTIAGKRVTIEQQNANTAAARAQAAQANSDRSYNLAVARLDASLRQKADSSLSKQLHYVVDSSGMPILRNGKRITLPTASTVKTPSAGEMARWNALALGLARIGHEPANGQPGVSWQKYLSTGLQKGIPAATLIKQGRKVYSQREIKLALIPAGGGKDTTSGG